MYNNDLAQLCFSRWYSWYFWFHDTREKGLDLIVISNAGRLSLTSGVIVSYGDVSSTVNHVYMGLTSYYKVPSIIPIKSSILEWLKSWMKSFIMKHFMCELLNRHWICGDEWHFETWATWRLDTTKRTRQLLKGNFIHRHICTKM